MTEFAQGPGGVRIAYEVLGEGEPILLIHGFASSRRINWRSTGWFDFLVGARRRVIAFDCRGHGESDKPHDVADYDEALMAGDAAAVLEAASARAVDVMGYSMGGYIAIRLAQDAPDRVQRILLGGVGGKYFSFWDGRSEHVARALEVPDKTTLTDPTEILFRDFAEKGGNDLVALAACMRRERHIATCEELGRLAQPALVACGAKDDISGPAEELARCFSHATTAVIPDRDHMLTVGDRKYKEAVAAFLLRGV